ncbi:MAG: cell wall hydrolase [Sphingorhabdus sp.]
MIKLTKAASAAALLLTIGSASILAVPGFASGDAEAETHITADLIKVDETVLAADAEALKIAKQDDMKPELGKNGEIVFKPGTGDFVQPMPDPEPKPEPKVTQKIPTNASSLRGLVRLQNKGASLDKQANCLAGAVYFESKGESLAGQLAVARVVMARAKSSRFPSSICGVVFQRSQFSFVRGGRMPRINKGGQHWRNAKAIAQIALANAWKSKMEGALFFHAKYVNPKWRLKRMGSVGLHIFYR